MNDLRKKLSVSSWRFCLAVSAYYIHPCQKNSPNVNECLTYAANHLAMHFRKGEFLDNIFDARDWETGLGRKVFSDFSIIIETRYKFTAREIKVPPVHAYYTADVRLKM